jgi:hypothetical protein
MLKKIIYSLVISLSLTSNSYALEDDGFPIKYEPEIKRKNYAFNLFYLDSFPIDSKISASEFRAEVKANFLNKNTGIISEVSFQHMLGTNPSVISGILTSMDNAHTHDAGVLVGYRFGITDDLGISPFLRARGIVTRGRGGDNLYGAELGAELNWFIYPETAELNLRYGLTVPIFHNYTGAPDIVSHTSFKLNTAELRLSYRIIENVNVMVGYQIKQFPKNLGNSNLATSDTFLWQSIILGAGYVF